ncbi:MAG: hypothetical protein KA010_01855 [Saprospiraceae bacterium]|nr:hypothetical protein [Saprospiraceae bacterium]
MISSLHLCCNYNGKDFHSPVKIRISAEPDVLMPHFSTNTYANQIGNKIFASLLVYSPYSGELRPFLATQLPVVKSDNNGISVLYEIREEAKWDDGTPVTGYDYEFTLKLILNKHIVKSKYLSATQYIDEIRVDPSNNKKFTVHCKNRYFLFKELTGTIPLVNESIFDENKELRKFDLKEFQSNDTIQLRIAQKVDEIFKNRNYQLQLGCNAYKYQNWQTGEKILLSKKQNWWGDVLAKQDSFFNYRAQSLEYEIVPDNNAALALFKSGGLDIVSGVPADEFQRLKKNNPTDVLLYENQLSNVHFFAINTLKQPILNDLENRRALFYLIDLEKFIKENLNGYATINANPFSNMRDYYDPSTPHPHLDIEKAKEILTKNGWKDLDNDGILEKKVNGKIIKFSISIFYLVQNQTIEPLLSSMRINAKKIGIDITYTPFEFTTLLARMKSKAFDIALVSFTQSPMPDDPYQTWHSSQISGEGINYTGFGDKASDGLIDSIRTTLDVVERKELLIQLQKQIYNQMPALFLYSLKDKVMMSNQLKNTFVSQVRPGYFENYFSK